jgi:SAM-dependent methyltransferase
MQTPPPLFDPDLLARRRERAARLGGADFLHAEVVAEIAERLKEVNRSFHAAAVVGPRPALWARLLAAEGVPVARAVTDAETLDLSEGAHDLVIHGLGLHWANDPVGQLVQARRALRPDGLLVAALFGGETLHELRRALAEAEVATTGGLSPRIVSMGGIRDLGALLQRAGFAMPVADGRHFDVTYASPLALMHDLRAMGETNVLRDRVRRPMPRALLAETLARYEATFGLPDGRVPASFDVVFLTGWAPAEDQPKPLRPGSAAVRLADALGAEERSAGEPAPGPVGR